MTSGVDVSNTCSCPLENKLWESPIFPNLPGAGGSQTQNEKSSPAVSGNGGGYRPSKNRTRETNPPHEIPHRECEKPAHKQAATFGDCPPGRDTIFSAAVRAVTSFGSSKMRLGARTRLNGNVLIDVGRSPFVISALKCPQPITEGWKGASKTPKLFYDSTGPPCNNAAVQEGNCSQPKRKNGLTRCPLPGNDALNRKTR